MRPMRVSLRLFLRGFSLFFFSLSLSSALFLWPFLILRRWVKKKVKKMPRIARRRIWRLTTALMRFCMCAAEDPFLPREPAPGMFFSVSPRNEEKTANRFVSLPFVLGVFESAIGSGQLHFVFSLALLPLPGRPICFQ